MAGVTFRGLDPRTSPIRWGLAAVGIGIALAATVPAALDGVAAAWDGNRASLPWLLERVFAFMAYIAMTGSVVYGLLLSTKILDAIAHRPVTFALHKDLAAIGLGLAAVHGALLGLDSSVPFSFAQILVPGLAPHAPVAVAFGQVALYLTAIVMGSFYVRRRIGQRTWRTLHYLTFLAFVGATAHGIAAGSDSASTWAQTMYLVAAASVTFLMVYRIATAIAVRGERTTSGVASMPGSPARAA